MQRYHEECYRRMEQLDLQGALGGNFFWAADLQQTAPEPLYIDVVHYSSGFSRIIAAAIAARFAADFTERVEIR